MTRRGLKSSAKALSSNGPPSEPHQMPLPFYLDGLFTSEVDAPFDGLLDSMPHIAFTLPETLPRELVDRRPPELF